MDQNLLEIDEPTDYFRGIGKGNLPTPTQILLYVRRTPKALQQQALQNRSHHRYVLMMNMETSGRVHVDSLNLPLAPGQALLVHPYQFHHFSKLARSSLLWLFCTFELESQSSLESLRNRVIPIDESTDRASRDLLQEWQTPEKEFHDENLQAGLLRLLLSLKRTRHRTGRDLPPEPKDDLVRTINRQLADWHSRTVGIADLADALNLSASHLRTRFKQTAGIPLGRYIQNYRINRAMALLRTSTRSMSQVAEEAGFGSPQAFNRVFKKETGRTPRSYRMQR